VDESRAQLFRGVPTGARRVLRRLRLSRETLTEFRRPRSARTPSPRALARHSRVPRCQRAARRHVPQLRRARDRVVCWLVGVRRASGSYANERGSESLFVTALVLRGLLPATDMIPGAKEAAARACDFLVEHMFDESPDAVSCGIRLCVAASLRQAGDVLERPEYGTASAQLLQSYCEQKEQLRRTHDHGVLYEIEALFDMECADLGRSLLESFIASGSQDRRLASADKTACSAWRAHLALCCYRAKAYGPAEQTVAWLERQQARDGGFHERLRGATICRHRGKASATAKFYFDAHRLRVISFMTLHADALPSVGQSALAGALALDAVCFPSGGRTESDLGGL